jgi:serine/threonine protein kinase
MCCDLSALQCMTYAGTVTYMSPERLENKPYNFSADIW